ncbi:hypothetical protein V1L52_02205 [Treponema sp. HNW]|uniref:hypothetical protein n=1 Tax=Treponema sp. HNW TaxID=3116654 RepID=UPI003D0F2B39
MDLIKDIDKLLFLLLSLFFMPFLVKAEEKVMIFAYEDSVANKTYTFNLTITEDDCILTTIDTNGIKLNYSLENEDIFFKIKSFFRNISIPNNENYCTIINSDVTEQIIFKLKDEDIIFLFYGKYIPLKESETGSNAVALVKELLSAIKQNNAEALIELSDWLYE